jgi:predicted  nucleic acid-binding Zn-ribbon protein
VNTEKMELNDVILECPHCLVCSIKLSAEEFVQVEAGQHMIEVCPVCGKEVYLNGSNQ